MTNFLRWAKQRKQIQKILDREFRQASAPSPKQTCPIYTSGGLRKFAAQDANVSYRSLPYPDLAER